MASAEVRGVVTDAPVPNARVVLSVGGSHFEAPYLTGSDGSFEVMVETGNPQAMVLSEADDPNGTARFVAMTNDFAGMQKTAGASGVISNHKITNVTTAHYLLALRNSEDGSIDSAEELRGLSAQLDNQELLEVAGAIKVVSENLENVSLPPGYGDTLVFAQHLVQGKSTFLNDLETTNPGLLQKAIDLVLTDGSATVSFRADDAAGVYVDTNGSLLLVLNSGGSGTATSADGSTLDTEATWSVRSDGVLQVYKRDLQELDEYTLVQDSAGMMNVFAKTSDPSTSSELNSGAGTMEHFEFLGGFDTSTVSGTYQDPDDPNVYYVFEGGRSGYVLDVSTGTVTENFVWSISSEGNLSVTYESGRTDTIWRLSGSTGSKLNALIESRDQNGSLSAVGFEAFAKTKGTLSAG